MSIFVNSTFANCAEYEDATGWHVDDEGRLHVIKAGDGNLATFHPSAWLSVERAEDAK